MATEQNKEIVRRAISAIGRGDLAGEIKALTEYMDTELAQECLWKCREDTRSQCAPSAGGTTAVTAGAEPMTRVVCPGPVVSSASVASPPVPGAARRRP